MRTPTSSRLLAALAVVLLSTTATSVLAAALPSSDMHQLARRANSDPRLSSVTRISDGQVEGIERLLNRTANKSWEIGTHLSALLELSYPALSPFADSTSWARPSPSSSPAPTEILNNVAQILENQPQGQQQLVSDGSAADPASVGPFVVLANFTLDGDEQIAGSSKAQVDEAVQRQVDVLMSGTPRTPDGAISHRTEDVELWSDFMYMVPPFFAYLGAVTLNSSLLTEAYTQCALYRTHLRDERTNLWRHIDNSFPGGGGRADAGLWATGNGWASYGLLRVLATIVNHPDDGVVEEFASQSRDLAAWAGEIIEGTWAQPRTNQGLRHNYLNESSSFGDSSGTAILSAATFRLSLLSRRFSTSAVNLTSPSSLALASAENSYRALVPDRVSSAGVVSPVVDPMSFREQLDGVKGDGSGASSPEGGAFVLLLEAARRDWVEENGGKEPSAVDAGVDGMWSAATGRGHGLGAGGVAVAVVTALALVVGA
ncbi:hypothetical protein JCM8208_005356 [Rhodotorula glutinis]